MASVQPGHSQGDLLDDESLLDDDLIEADHGTITPRPRQRPFLEATVMIQLLTRDRYTRY